jgi:hypothetical protein
MKSNVQLLPSKMSIDLLAEDDAPSAADCSEGRRFQNPLPMTLLPKPPISKGIRKLQIRRDRRRQLDFTKRADCRDDMPHFPQSMESF